ncbi:MAG: ankyrin repeat domain-containing protein [Pyrinomonadaceae bacterium]
MSKKNIVDLIKVKKPCTESWGEMTGGERVRFCSHCAKSVNDISAMTRKEALRLIRSSGGNLCVRYIQDPKTQRPMFADGFVQISRRAPRIAAGVMSASLTLATLGYGQAPVQTEAGTGEKSVITEFANRRQTKIPEPINGEGARLSGTALDPNGAVIPNIYLTLINENDSAKRTTITNSDGAYGFEDLEPGSYTLRSDASQGFAQTQKSGIQISDGDNARQDIQMDAARILMMGDIAISVRYNSPLSKAVAEDNVEEVRNLITGGANVNGKEEDDSSPLFLAVGNGNLEITEMLLSFGAKANLRDQAKQTALMSLDEDASKDLVELLVRYGAKINLRDAQGNTALILASLSAKPEVLQSLIDAGADVNEQNLVGQPALINAAYSEDLEAVRTLLLAGADVNAKNNSGETACDKTSNNEIEQLLVSYGAVPKVTNMEGVEKIEQIGYQDPR